MFLSISKANVKQAAFWFPSWSGLNISEVIKACQGLGLAPPPQFPSANQQGELSLYLSDHQQSTDSLVDNGKGFLEMYVTTWETLTQRSVQSWGPTHSSSRTFFFFPETALEINEGVKVAGL